MASSVLSIIHLVVLFSLTHGQLIVNVRNGGGEVYTEKIDANTTQDSITLEFRQSDGTLITQFIDGRNEIHIFKAVILPELELGQSQVQTVCFVLRFSKTDFIASDAMSKLRQKNPGAVRHPEEQKPDEQSQFDARLDVRKSNSISPHILELCSDALHTTYARTADIRLLSEILNRNYSTLESAILPLGSSQSSKPCSAHPNPSTSQNACLCRYDICIGWYPCGLKYCRGKDSSGRIVSYRCGIRTCGLCRHFEFPVPNRQHCSWDHPDFDPEVEFEHSGRMDLGFPVGDDLEGAGGSERANFDENWRNYGKEQEVGKSLNGGGIQPAGDLLDKQPENIREHREDLKYHKQDLKQEFLGQKDNIHMQNIREVVRQEQNEQQQQLQEKEQQQQQEQKQLKDPQQQQQQQKQQLQSFQLQVAAEKDEIVAAGGRIGVNPGVEGGIDSGGIGLNHPIRHHAQIKKARKEELDKGAGEEEKLDMIVDDDEDVD